jgi:hypothetical protein
VDITNDYYENQRLLEETESVWDETVDKVKSCAKVVVNIVGDTTKDLDSKSKKENLH